MRPGTIVVCLPCPVTNPRVKWAPIMDEKTPYIVREYIPGWETASKRACVYFEEGVIGYESNGREIGFPTDYLRELLPPGEMSTEIIEVLEEPILVN